MLPMERERLTSIILGSPARVRLGLTVSDERLRERASDALAATILDRLQSPPPVRDKDQLPLPL